MLPKQPLLWGEDDNGELPPLTYNCFFFLGGGVMDKMMEITPNFSKKKGLPVQYHPPLPPPPTPYTVLLYTAGT